jgi:alkylation response protein AidB-like acyl-CoA dehydrogenase
MDYNWPAELDELRDEAAAFVEQATNDLFKTDDGWLVGYSKEFTLRLAEQGWIGMTWPKSAGGDERPEVERFVVTEQLLLGGAPMAGSFFPDRQIGPVLLAYGSKEQQDRWIPEMRAGLSQWCIGMSEPDAGSNVAGIQTKAVRDGDNFIVNGQKIWTSGGNLADYCYLICRTNPEGPPHKGMSELVVDMTSPGITINPIKDASGDAHFCEVFFDDVEVPADHLVGELNNSFGQTMRQLEHERGGIDRLASNQGLYQHMLTLADTSDPLIRQDIARLETGYRIGRDMVLRNVLKQAPLAQYSAITKTFCTEHEQRVADFVSRVAGADATIWGRAARNIVYAPAYTIMGGTTQILRNIIGERILGLPREPRPQ